jgi:NAD(P)-dependent dehydrogenase (short-subunit alcohol dehydrogenase family)
MPFPAADVSDRSIAQLISLKGRRAVVTGAARGVGTAIARRLAEAGADVAVGDLDEPGAARAAQAVAKEFPVRVATGPLDVTDAGSVSRFAEQTVRALGGIDIWVNNAGVFPAARFLEMTDEQWDRMSDVNLRGTFLGCREAARRMIGDGATGGNGGVIINVTSIASFRGRVGLAHYAASKHGAAGLTLSLAAELGRSGIRVLAVAPAIVQTPGLAESMVTLVPPGAKGPSVAEMQEMVKAKDPLGRIALPDDIARVVLFAASDLAAFMTGTTLVADGGITAT